MLPNPFNSRSTLSVNGAEYTIFRLDALEKAGLMELDRLPFSLPSLCEC